MLTTIQPAKSAHCKLAVDVKVFQHLRDAGDAGISPEGLADKTGVQLPLLLRLMRHLVAMHMVSLPDGKFHATPLSDGLAEEKYQDSIAFCYDVARPSFNGSPDFFKHTGV